MNDQNNQLDQATSVRLGKLASMPVDVSRLERRMAEAMHPAESQQPQSLPLSARHRSTGWLRVAAAAASRENRPSTTLRTGVYYVKMTVGNQQLTKKLIRIK